MCAFEVIDEACITVGTFYDDLPDGQDLPVTTVMTENAATMTDDLEKDPFVAAALDNISGNRRKLSTARTPTPRQTPSKPIQVFDILI